ncbi:MAG: Kae1-associated kinase Bud32 [Fervidicoccaceae archaeon]
MEKLKISPLSWGAESNLYLGHYLGRKVVVKERIRKPYMPPKLSERLVRERTISEARILWEANLIGVKAPLPLKVEPEAGVIIMSYIEGKLLRDMIFAGENEQLIREIMRIVGEYVAKLHNFHIIHGDLTTSNIIYKTEAGPFIIDFGLSFRSKRVEDKAMDLRVLERAVESTHPEHKDELMPLFYEKYFSEVNESELIGKSLEEIRLRGRYIKERQKQ